jgi:hypothetical protein
MSKYHYKTLIVEFLKEIQNLYHVIVNQPYEPSSININTQSYDVIHKKVLYGCHQLKIDW